MMAAFHMGHSAATRAACISFHADSEWVNTKRLISLLASASTPWLPIDGFSFKEMWSRRATASHQPDLVKTRRRSGHIPASISNVGYSSDIAVPSSTSLSARLTACRALTNFRSPDNVSI